MFTRRNVQHRLPRALSVSLVICALALPAALTAASAEGAGERTTDVSAAEVAVDPQQSLQLSQEIVWREDFDSRASSLQPRVNDPGIAAGTVGFTHTGPSGWTVTKGNQTKGVKEWDSWSFTTRAFWLDAENQQRGWFTRADDIIAVADSDEFADVSARGTYNTTLTSPPISVAGQTNLELSFDSHYRQEGAQRALVQVSFDGATPVQLMRYDSATTSKNSGVDVLSAREVLPVIVPSGATTAKFSFVYGNQNNAWFWAIDNVELASPMPTLPAGEVPTVIHVVSDIQGDPTSLRTAVAKFNTLDPNAQALYLVGDITSNGLVSQYTEVRNALVATPHVSGRYGYVLGNHELYDSGSNSAALITRFLDWAGRSTVWEEQVFNGVPVLSIGTEKYEYTQRTGGGPFLTMSTAQLDWLEERVNFWSAQNKPVLVMSHHVLPMTVSGTYADFYRQDFETLAMQSRFLGIMSAHPNAVFFTGHTHWSLGLRDWAVRETYTGGDPRGFAVINTGAIANVYGPSGDANETLVNTTDSSGLRVSVYSDRVRVQGYDFYRSKVLQTVDIPMPG